jgi:ABC-type phosphate transport system permease subunit
MKKLTLKFIFITFFTLTTLSLGIVGVFAQDGNDSSTATDSNLICRVFPFIEQISFTQSLCGTANAAETIGPWVTFVLSLIFIGIILLAVVSIIKAAIVYIRSEGDEGKVQEASKAIKSVFIGIGALIAGLVGLAIVITVIGASEALSGGEAPESVDDFINQL